MTAALPRGTHVDRPFLFTIGPRLFPYTTHFRSPFAPSTIFTGRGFASVFAGSGTLTSTSPSANVAVTSSSFVPSGRSEEHTSELQSQSKLVCRLLLEKQNAAA